MSRNPSISRSHHYKALSGVWQPLLCSKQLQDAPEEFRIRANESQANLDRMYWSMTMVQCAFETLRAEYESLNMWRRRSFLSAPYLHHNAPSGPGSWRIKLLTDFLVLTVRNKPKIWTALETAMLQHISTFAVRDWTDSGDLDVEMGIASHDGAMSAPFPLTGHAIGRSYYT